MQGHVQNVQAHSKTRHLHCCNFWGVHLPYSQKSLHSKTSGTCKCVQKVLLKQLHCQNWSSMMPGVLKQPLPHHGLRIPGTLPRVHMKGVRRQHFWEGFLDSEGRVGTEMAEACPFGESNPFACAMLPNWVHTKGIISNTLLARVHSRHLWQFFWGLSKEENGS